jgi:hypothetical protein
MVEDPRAPLRLGALRPLIEPWLVVIRSRLTTEASGDT